MFFWKNIREMFIREKGDFNSWMNIIFRMIDGVV